MRPSLTYLNHKTPFAPLNRTFAPKKSDICATNLCPFAPLNLNDPIGQLCHFLIEKHTSSVCQNINYVAPCIPRRGGSRISSRIYYKPLIYYILRDNNHLKIKK